MKNLWFCKSAMRTRISFPAAALLLVLLAAGPAAGRAPDWLHQAAQQPLGTYPADTDAVILYDEQILTVSEKGEIKAIVRRAYRILRPQGRGYAEVTVPFDNETRITFLKAWSLPAQGKEYEVKEKDAIEHSEFGGTLYEDTRYKIIHIPAAEPGNVIGYEYEQRMRPFVLQGMWFFQLTLPVRRARFVLRLPPGWEYETQWFHHPEQAPRQAGPSESVWELTDLPAVQWQPLMPPWRSVAGWMGLHLAPTSAEAIQRSHRSWADVGRWYARLAHPRRQSTPEIQQQVSQLTAGAPTTLEQIRRLAAFAQRDIRYVAIEIGIGGYQPHAAAEVFRNRYGDCKDKATLLAAMLREIGVDSHYVIIHTDRGVVQPRFATPGSFNHVILAIRLPDDVPAEGLHSVRAHDTVGRLLFFDPTDPATPLGLLPSTLQANLGLLVTDDGGELVELPLAPPEVNRFVRRARLILAPGGGLAGEVEEVHSGAPAVRQRSRLLRATPADRQKMIESLLLEHLGGFRLTDVQVDNLESYDGQLVLRYRFTADNYAKRAGSLLLVRPRVIGQKSSDLLEGEERKYPFQFLHAALQDDTFEIALPLGYQVDELPAPVDADYGFARYRSEVKVEGNVLRYQRTYQINDVWVPAERLSELKKLYRQMAADERSSAVLKRAF